MSNANILNIGIYPNINKYLKNTEEWDQLTSNIYIYINDYQGGKTV
jgi:hypothetical protein